MSACATTSLCIRLPSIAAYFSAPGGSGQRRSESSGESTSTRAGAAGCGDAVVCEAPGGPAPMTPARAKTAPVTSDIHLRIYYLHEKGRAEVLMGIVTE